MKKINLLFFASGFYPYMAHEFNKNIHPSPIINEFVNNPFTSMVHEQNSYLMKNNSSLSQINKELSGDNYKLNQENTYLKYRVAQMEKQIQQQNIFRQLADGYQQEFLKSMNKTGNDHHKLINNSTWRYPSQQKFILPHENSNINNNFSQHHITEKQPCNENNNRVSQHHITEKQPCNQTSFPVHGPIYPSGFSFGNLSSLFNQEAWDALQNKFYMHVQQLHITQEENQQLKTDIIEINKKYDQSQREINKKIILIHDLQKKNHKLQLEYKDLQMEMYETEDQLTIQENQWHHLQLLLLAVIQWGHQIQPISLESIKKNFQQLRLLMKNHWVDDVNQGEFMFKTILDLHGIPPVFFEILRLLNDEDVVVKLFDLGFFKQVIAQQIHQEIGAKRTKIDKISQTSSAALLYKNNFIKSPEVVEEFSLDSFHENIIINKPWPMGNNIIEQLIQDFSPWDMNNNPTPLDKVAITGNQDNPTETMKSLKYENLAAVDKMDVDNNSRKISLQNPDEEAMVKSNEIAQDKIHESPSMK